ncbi:MAG: polyhydroxyalkanoic acid synthase [Comamonadaceae bacterium]|nr:MAG: polyhydroxyalkanoic acid synthase [Comamonadaceae bacterium]
MADIHIVREHALGLAGARKLAFRWAEVAEKKLEMECTYEEGKLSDVVGFKRPGASGELKVTKDRFVLDARLGLLLGVFKGKIESEIVKNLDQLLDHEDPLHAFEQGLAKHEAKHDTKHAKHAKAHVAQAPGHAPRKSK